MKKLLILPIALYSLFAAAEARATGVDNDCISVDWTKSGWDPWPEFTRLTLTDGDGGYWRNNVTPNVTSWSWCVAQPSWNYHVQLQDCDFHVCGRTTSITFPARMLVCRGAAPIPLTPLSPTPVRIRSAP